MRREQREIREHIIQVCWYMRGGMTRDEAWVMSHYERQEVMKFIKERVEFVEKTGLAIL